MNINLQTLNINKLSKHYGIPNESRSYLLNWNMINPSPYNRIGGGMILKILHGIINQKVLYDYQIIGIL